MCGIVGIVSVDLPLKDIQSSVRVVNKMIDDQAHRGPDGYGIWNDAYCVFGHRRLSIIDLTSAAQQPMVVRTVDNIALVFNGEIYNYEQLKAELMNKSHNFSSCSDTEVLLHSYLEWGVDCIDRLQGMFAFAIWDGNIKRLILARDRLGKKPLFFSTNNRVVTFSSKLRSILKDSSNKSEINWSGIDQYLSYGYIPSPETAYSNIHKLQPGYIAIVDPLKPFATYKYWTLSYLPKQNINEDEAVEIVRHKLKTSVLRRMRSDVPVGAFLSGGVDSSIVVGLMAELSGQQIKTFSVGFKHKNYNELNFAREVSKKWCTDHNEYQLDDVILRDLPEMIRHLGEPFADVSILPTWHLSKFSKQHVKVVMTGDGGDECFAGYERYLAIKLGYQVCRIPGASYMTHQLLSKLNYIRSHKTLHSIGIEKIVKLLEKVLTPPLESYPKWMTFFTEGQKSELYNYRFNNLENDYLKSLLSSFSYLRSIDLGMAVDINSYLPEDLLVKLDISTMAHGIEARSPFLDHDLLEDVATFPINFKMKCMTPKYILKKSFSHLLPKEIVQRSKMGFGVPVGSWFRGSQGKLLRSGLLDIKLPLLNRTTIEKYLNLHLDNSTDYSFQLWNLLILNLWFDSIRND